MSNFDMFSSMNESNKIATTNAASLLMPTVTPKTAASHAQSLLASGGKKSSQQFVEKLAKVLKEEDLSAEDMQVLYMGFRSYSLLNDAVAPAGRGFDAVLTGSLQKSHDNLKSKGQTEEQIQASKPRVAYRERGNKLKALLTKTVWAKNAESSLLNWGTIAQLDWFKSYCSTIAQGVLNKTQPPFQPAFYLNAFWSQLDWEDASKESMARMRIVIRFAQFIRELHDKKQLKIEKDKTGKVISIDNKDLLLTKYFANGEKKIETKWSDYANLSDINPMQANPGSLLDLCILLDPRKLLQNKDYKLSKGDSQKHKEMKTQIINLARTLIFASIYLGHSVEKSHFKQDKLSLGVKAGFTDEMYGAYNYVHTYIRTLKRELYGTAGGADTRTADEAEMVSLQTSVEDVVKNLIKSGNF